MKYEPTFFIFILTQKLILENYKTVDNLAYYGPSGGESAAALRTERWSYFVHGHSGDVVSALFC